jgi:hypothetical protein
MERSSQPANWTSQKPTPTSKRLLALSKVGGWPSEPSAPLIPTTQPDHPTGGQYAHTSPIYVDVADRPAESREDALYFLKWIDRLALAVRLRDRIPSAELRAHVESQLESARDVYRSLAD